MSLIQIDEQLVAVIIRSTADGLAMAGLKPTAVGVSKFVTCRESVSAIIGFVGQTSGSIILNTSDACACFLAGRMLGETLTRLDSQTLDGISEIANIIAGQTKAVLSATEHRFERISTPSVIIGNSYTITHYRGMTTVSVEFELPEMPIKPGQIPTFIVNMALMRV